MTDNGSDLVLDGSAAAGLLQEILALDITTAQVECAECGSTGAVDMPGMATSRIRHLVWSA